jgi:hypothetical protein
MILIALYGAMKYDTGMTNQPTTEGISEAARALAGQRRRVTTICVVCGTETTGTTKRRYCSDACRVRGRYWAKKGVTNPPPARTYTRRDDVGDGHDGGEDGAQAGEQRG